MIYSCINLHFTDFCNYHCTHCFVKKENCELTFDELTRIVNKIKNYFDNNNIDGRINLAGGEPLISRNIDRLITMIASKGIKVSIITNGYFLDEGFINRHKDEIDTIGISVDSLDYETNSIIGRCYKKNTVTREKLLDLAKIIKSYGIKLKINTCLSTININEDFNEFINEIKPDRYKILQMCCDENDYKNKVNCVDSKMVEGFLKKINYDYVFECCEDMTKAYIIIDSLGNVSTNNSHVSNISIFGYELEDAIKLIDIDYDNYIKRYI